MATGRENGVICYLRRAALLQNAGDMTDGRLLERFLSAREEAAFELLVRRHGPMVLGVCRRVLSNSHDADDAFQAAFLVLIRKGPSLLSRQTLGNWLYGVAYHTALKARAACWKRRAKERQAAAMAETEAPPDGTGHDFLPILDQELDRLPDKYREAVVLCELEGKTRDEAARQLGVPVGTLSGRLTTARRMLAKRLTRRGVTLSSAALTAVLTPSFATAGVPPALLGSTLKAASALAAGKTAIGVISAEVAALTQGMLKSMLLTKLKLTVPLLLSAVVLAGGASVWSHQLLAAPTQETLHDEPEQPGPSEISKVAAPKVSDKQQLQGVWIPIASMVQGQKKDPADAKLQMWKLLFDGDRVTIPDDRTVRYTVDSNKNPKQMDIFGKDGKPMMMVIYELEADKLRFSFKKTYGSVTESDRPTDFDTAKNESVLIVLKRRNAP
jgi:RNA polymerase sigma-70 factor (ECF subfamily)